MKSLLNLTFNFTVLFCPCIFSNNFTKQSNSKLVRILGGQNAVPHSAPWMISFHSEVGYFCGGSLLNEKWIVTAGHCFYTNSTTEEYVQAVAGTHDYSIQSETEQRRTVDKIIIHPDYNDNDSLVDIALVRVSNSFDFNDFVTNIGLPSAHSTYTGDATFFGWGLVEENLIATVLQTITLQIFDYGECVRIYNQYNLNIGASDSHLCAGITSGEGSTCKGDSGSGLVQNNKLIGIDSRGAGICKQNYIPAVLTKVASYIDWIHLSIHHQ